MLLLLALLLAGLGLAVQPPQSFDAEHARVARANPDWVGLTASLPQPARFRPGQIIPLTLEFTTRDADAPCVINTASYDRSGRLRIDRIIVDRQAEIVDPLGDYFGRAFGFIGGGLSSQWPWKNGAYHIELDLNEWVTFTRPGRYRLSIYSGRLQKSFDQPDRLASCPPVTSNVVDLEIVASDPAWSKAAMQAALDELKGAPGGEGARDAARTLRFLGTPEAAQTMVDLLARRPDPQVAWELRAGLYSTPHRQLAIAVMESFLDRKEPKEDNEFLRTVALLRLWADEGTTFDRLDQGRMQRLRALENRYIDRRNAGRRELVAIFTTDCQVFLRVPVSPCGIPPRPPPPPLPATRRISPFAICPSVSTTNSFSRARTRAFRSSRESPWNTGTLH